MGTLSIQVRTVTGVAHALLPVAPLRAPVSAALKETDSRVTAGTTHGALTSGHRQTNREGTGFQSLALFCSTEITWSHSETGVIEGGALSSRYCVAAWSAGEAALGKQKQLLQIDLLYDRFRPPLLSSVIRLKHCTRASSKMTQSLELG